MIASHGRYVGIANFPNLLQGRNCPVWVLWWRTAKDYIDKGCQYWGRRTGPDQSLCCTGVGSTHWSTWRRNSKCKRGTQQKQSGLAGSLREMCEVCTTGAFLHARRWTKPTPSECSSSSPISVLENVLHYLHKVHKDRLGRFDQLVFLKKPIQKSYFDFFLVAWMAQML